MSDEYLKMCEDFTLLVSSAKSISGSSVFEILKKYSSEISVFDMMDFTSRVIEENKFVQENFRQDSQKSYIESFLYRIKDIQKDTADYSKNIDKDALGNAIQVLKANHSKVTSDDKSLLITYIASFYATFLLEESIHPVGTPFPGSLKLEEKDGKFYCPVKNSNIGAPNAFCKICLAEQQDF